MRQLATLQRITELNPIEGADKIEVAKILGWNVVVRKGDFAVHQLVAFFEVDSFLPIRPEFGFLQKNGVKRMLVEGKEVEGYRLKTIKLRGTISQGLILPLTDFLELDPLALEGTDITELLGVVQYEMPISAQLAGKMRGNFPGFIPKTDETRLQAYPDLLYKYQNDLFYVTEKIDGSSVTFYIKDGEFHACSRNMDLFEVEGNSIWKLAREMKIEEKLRGLGEEGCALQGEIFGEGIQKNPLKVNGQQIRFLTLYNFIEGKYVGFGDFITIMEKMEMPVVPLIDPGFTLLKRVDDMVSYATRKSVINPESWAEGFVFRSLVEMQDEDLGRLSFKVLNPEYLLKNES